MHSLKHNAILGFYVSKLAADVPVENPLTMHIQIKIFPCRTCSLSLYMRCVQMHNLKRWLHTLTPSDDELA
jgi:hypothetical protein